jgi:hypothetical protein
MIKTNNKSPHETFSISLKERIIINPTQIKASKVYRGMCVEDPVKIALKINAIKIAAVIITG